jgi:MEMO1 family protein
MSDEGRAGGSPAEESPRGEGVDPLVALARASVKAYVSEGRVERPDLPSGTEPARAGVFVSLHLPDGSLRGCIGTFLPTKQTLAQEIVANAISAATRDPRFHPVRPAEIDGLHISVDVLEAPEEVCSVDDLDCRCYGIIARTEDGRQALLLPDLEGVDTVEQQIEITCRKGGIDPRKDAFTLSRFRVTRHV